MNSSDVLLLQKQTMYEAEKAKGDKASLRRLELLVLDIQELQNRRAKRKAH